MKRTLSHILAVRYWKNKWFIERFVMKRRISHRDLELLCNHELVIQFMHSQNLCEFKENK